MKNRRFSLSAILILSVLIAVYLVWDYLRDESKLQVLTICNNACQFEDTDILYLNTNRTWRSLGSTSTSCDTVGLPASEGDLLFFSNPWDDFDYYRYRLSDGQLLTIEYDTLLPGATFLNGKLLSVFTKLEPDWQRDLTMEQMRELREIYISSAHDTMSEEVGNLLEKISAVNKHVGLLIDDDNVEEFHKVLAMFSPEWMAVGGDLLGTLDDSLQKNLKELELLYLTDPDPDNLSRLGRLSGLESLIIDYSDSSDTIPVQLELLKGLKSLTLVGYDGTTFTGQELPRSLNSLYLVACGSISDVSWLDQYPMLRDLSMARCDSLRDLSVLDGMHMLRWLSLPPGVSQETFNGILDRHPGLEGLELIGCEELSDLSALVKLKKLKYLGIDLRKIDFASLKQLQHIKLIVINEKHFSDDATEIESLKAALPDAFIVPGSGYCLGSGWLMLMLPFLMAAVVLRTILRR